ncbi:MAG: peptide-methionine (R)-S-oxide reductase MsrB [Pyrinomonadaceae bacterium]
MIPKTSSTEKETSASGYDIMPISAEKREELAQNLTEEQRDILLNHGTEPPFCGNLTDNKQDGTYACRLCGLPLFRSDSKFHSKSGWASFYQPFDKDHIRYLRDTKYGMARTEIRCSRCDGHLGHVFDDGPPPTGQRYCMNSASLEFFPEDEEVPQKV